MLCVTISIDPQGGKQEKGGNAVTGGNSLEIGVKKLYFAGATLTETKVVRK
jgi:hypothetical protein